MFPLDHSMDGHKGSPLIGWFRDGSPWIGKRQGRLRLASRGFTIQHSSPIAIRLRVRSLPIVSQSGGHGLSNRHGSSAHSGVWLWLALCHPRPAPPASSEQVREAGGEKEPDESRAHVCQL